MLATFDDRLQLRDLYYPYVGLEDHTTFGKVHRVGVWVEGRGFAWFSDASWKVDIHYRLETLVGSARLTNEQLGIALDVEDFVPPVCNILLRKFTIHSLDKQPKVVRLFFNHDFYIYGDKQKDTAFYEPYTNSVIHFREKRYFLIGGETDNPQECTTGRSGEAYASILHSRKKLTSCGISSYTVGKSNYRGLEGTWRDAEDGDLSRNPIEQGSVDSTVGLHCLVEGDKPTEALLWVCIGKTLDDVVNLQQTIMDETPERLYRNCANYWRSWVNKTTHDFGSLSPELVDLYKRSLFMIRLHADNNGGILAAADSDIMAFNRDTYTYVWHRDGALVSCALDQAGYGEVARRFYDFTCRSQSPDGYMLHKYNPDASIGSSWHPWCKNGEAQLPIQCDETALPIYAIWKHFEINQDFEFLQEMYERFVNKAAKFLSEFREPETGLPLPSYDPWEEHRGVFSYTTACTIAGLHAAARICHILGHYKHSERYQTVADEMHQALLFHLYDEKLGRFLKKIERKGGKTVDRDATVDASLCFLWKLGVLPVDDPRIVSTMRQIREVLGVRTPVGGIARYANDFYHCAVQPTAEIPGNPWIITTLWDAQWTIAQAKTKDDLSRARAELEWVQKLASPSGILPEQVNSLTGAPLSVAPLTWSHATFVETILAYIQKEAELSRKRE